MIQITKNLINSLAIMSVTKFFNLQYCNASFRESLSGQGPECNALQAIYCMCLSIITNWSCPHDPSPHTGSARVCVWVLLQNRWSVCLWIGTAPAYQCCTTGLQCSKPHSTETTGQTQTCVSSVSTTAHPSVHVFTTKQMFPSQHLLTYTSVDGWKDIVVKITIHIFYCMKKNSLYKIIILYEFGMTCSHTYTVCQSSDVIKPKGPFTHPIISVPQSHSSPPAVSHLLSRPPPHPLAHITQLIMLR